MPSITTWTRLEPQSRTSAMDQGLQAKVHDPLWLLARQWQFGEFQAEDAGTPVSARLRGQLAAIGRYHAGTLGDGSVTGHPYNGQVPLETLVEAESLTQTFHPGRAIEAGLHFMRLLKAHGVGQYRSAYQTQYPLPEVTSEAYQDGDSRRYLRVMTGRAINGQQLFADLSRALHLPTGIGGFPNPPTEIGGGGFPNPPTGIGGLPRVPSIAAGDAAAILAAAESWLSWYSNRFDQPQPDHEAWISERMEHTFAVSVPTPTEEAVYVSHEYHGGRLDWYHFNQNQHIGLGGPVGEHQTTPCIRTVMPGSISFQGMPDARWWTFEDAQLNLSTLSAGPEDLGRMLLLQYALAYSDDWFIMPVEMEIGKRLDIQSLVVTDTFGVRTLIRPFSEVDGATGSWRMFTHTLEDLEESDALPAANHLFLPPVLATSLHGVAIEEIHLLRDEMANMAWAVEAKVENARGQSNNRHESTLIQRGENAVSSPPNAETPDTSIPNEAELLYTLMTDVPAHWVPLVPIQDPNTQSLKLHRGRMLMYQGEQLVDLPPWGRLLTPNTSLKLEEEEVGRDGAQVIRRYQATRWHDGTIHLWMGRQKQIGRGEGWSGLRFDGVEPNSNLADESRQIEPTLFAIHPAAARQGQIVEMTLIGRGLSDVSAVTFGSTGLKTRQMTVINDKQVSFELVVDEDASVGLQAFQVSTPSHILESQTFNLGCEILASVPESEPVDFFHSLPLGAWTINGNGHEGELNLSFVDDQGNLSGTVFDNPIQGFWSEASQTITFERITTPNTPSRLQIYTGYLFKTPVQPKVGQDITYTLTGFFEAFAGTGAVAEKMLYGWMASIVVSR